MDSRTAKDISSLIDTIYRTKSSFYFEDANGERLVCQLGPEHQFGERVIIIRKISPITIYEDR